MELNDTLVDKLAHLARLEFNNTEKQEIKTDLQRMIAFVENKMDAVNTMINPVKGTAIFAAIPALSSGRFEIRNLLNSSIFLRHFLLSLQKLPVAGAAVLYRHIEIP